jgi:hypothetical protein
VWFNDTVKGDRDLLFALIRDFAEHLRLHAEQATRVSMIRSSHDLLLRPLAGFVA